MSEHVLLIAAAAIAFLLSRLATPAIRCAAIANGFVDCPDRRRKLQKEPIPLGGGIAVWLATWAGWIMSLLVAPLASGVMADWDCQTLALAASSFLILVLGLFDDRFGMRGTTKLVGQVIATAALVTSGVRINAFGGFGLEFGLGGFAVPITIFGIVLVINAFNLIDGMDGFCGSLGLVASLAVALISIGLGRLEDAVLGLALAGGLAGFLVDNLPPARIYLGDAGSMSVGMVTAYLAIRASSDGPGSPVSLPLLVALLILPVLDVAASLARRWLSGHSMFASDRGHIHHRLRTRLPGNAAALGVGILLATLAASGAVIQRARGSGDLTASLLIVATIVPLVGTDTFGGAELRLLAFRLRSTMAGFLTRNIRGRAARHDCHLHGEWDWANVWDALIREAQSAGVCRIELAIEMPAAGEAYHGRWSLSGSMEGRPIWSVTHSLCVDGVDAGTLRVAGWIADCRPRYLDSVGMIVRAVEDRLQSTASDHASTSATHLPAASVVHVN